MPVLVCVLARNNWPLTRACLKSALAQSYPSGVPYPGNTGTPGTSDAPTVGVLLLDNASTDSTPQWLASMVTPYHPRGFSTIMLRHRLSVAACWNYVLEWAFSPANPNHYDGVLMLNNDTEIRPDTVEWLMRDSAPFVTAISVRSESELNFPSPPTSRQPHPDFSCFMIKPACWKKVGRFDEEFELAYCEDSDYHVRMHMAGVPAICLDLPFLHHGASTIGQADKAERRLIERAADRNRARFEDMYGCLPGSEGYNEIFKSPF